MSTTQFPAIDMNELIHPRLLSRAFLVGSPHQSLLGSFWKVRLAANKTDSLRSAARYCDFAPGPTVWIAARQDS
jgi:hypothetical protein